MRHPARGPKICSGRSRRVGWRKTCRATRKQTTGSLSRRQGGNPHMTGLVPMFEKYHVTAGFFGHDHNYQHYLKNGIHYVITGGGGAPLYDVNKPPAGITQKVVSIENFVSVSVQGKSAHVRAIAVDGHVLDEFDMTGTAQP